MCTTLATIVLKSNGRMHSNWTMDRNGRILNYTNIEKT